jgi:hypothetical protein
MGEDRAVDADAPVDPETARRIDRAVREGKPLVFSIGHAVARLSHNIPTHMDADSTSTVQVTLPPTPLCLQAQRRGVFTGVAARLGLAVDLRTGDPLFDDAWEVEAAPDDIARALFDADVRDGFRRGRPSTVTLREDSLTVTRVNPDVYEQWRAMVDLAVLLTRRIPAATQAVCSDGATGEHGAGAYRGDRAGLPLRHATQAENLARLEAVRKRRRAAKAVAGVIGVLVGVAARDLPW